MSPVPSIARPESSNPLAPWAPLLEGEHETEAWRAVLDIARALEPWPDERVVAPHLGSGAAGIALFFSYLAEVTGQDRWANVAVACVERMLESVGQSGVRASLYSGFTGAAWTLEHLMGRLFDADATDVDARDADATGADATDADEMLLFALRQGSWVGDYDLVNGLVGFGIYALEALPRASADLCLRLILGQLANLAERRTEGLTWPTPPELLPAHQRRTYPRGYTNLGLAHGVPGVLGFLGALCAAGIEEERARKLLGPACSWLLAQEHGPEVSTCFPHSLAEGVKPSTSRLAWCYGDPGVALGLLHAGNLAGHRVWREHARRIALDAARRPATAAGISDAGLCHGSAGLAHMLARFHQAFGEPDLATAARYWYRHALELRNPGSGLGGYLAYAAPIDTGTTVEAPQWHATPGFLEGSAGIGLALLAAISPHEPAWDRLLMISIRATPTAHPSCAAEIDESSSWEEVG